MEIYNSDFKRTTWDEETSVIANYWKEASMTDDDFQKEILVWVDQVEQYKPLGLLADTRKFKFVVSIEQQEWTNNDVFPRLIGAGAKKFAIVESEELIAQLSIEQVLEESEATFQSQYFTSTEDALDWLNK